jgi:hypothetical protein
MNERQIIQDLSGRLNRVLDSCDGTAGCVAVAALMTAARYARRAQMPAEIAAAMVVDYIARGDPV